MTGRGRGRGVTQGGGSVLGRGRGRGRAAGGGGGGDSSSTVEFMQATSTNLPSMSFFKVAEYFKSLRSPELRQAKTS